MYSSKISNKKLEKLKVMKKLLMLLYKAQVHFRKKFSDGMIYKIFKMNLKLIYAIHERMMQ